MSKPKIVITVRGGCVVAVASTNMNTEVELLDWDNYNPETKTNKKEMNVLYKKAAKMHQVF